MSEIYKFIHAAEKLKNELRHSYTSANRRESVAEHSWRFCLMVLILGKNIPDIDNEKCLKMALIHDLPEIFEGDSYRLDLEKQTGKQERETAALEKLLQLVPAYDGDEIRELWMEFEEGTTADARFVRLIDRLEVLVQHNEADLNTWADLEKRLHWGLAAKHAAKYGFLADFAAEIDEEARIKLLKAGNEPHAIEQSEYLKYYGGQ